MFFKHYKGRYYQSLGYVTQANNDSTMVLYTPLYQCDTRFFVREYLDFVQMIEFEGRVLQRFIPILEYKLPEEARQYIVKTDELGSILATTKASYGILSQ